MNKFPRDLQEDFKKNLGRLHRFKLLCNEPNLLHLVEHVRMSSNQNMICTTWGHGTDKKKTTSFLNKWSSTLLWPETNAVDHRHFRQKFPRRPYKLKDISMISRSCRHPENIDRPFPATEWLDSLLYLSELRPRCHCCHAGDETVHKQRILQSTATLSTE